MAKDKSRRDGEPDGEGPPGATLAAIENGLEDAHRYLKRHWSERPVTVVAAALGAGLLIGLLLGGRR